MQAGSSRETGPLGVASINHIFKETLEGWWSSCKKAFSESQEIRNEFSVEIKSREQLLALVAHLALLAAGFKVQEKRHDENYSRLPVDWNANEPYHFEYTHSQSQLHFQVKTITIGNRSILHATALETSETQSLETVAEEFIPDQVVFPMKISSVSQISELDLSKLFSSHSKFSKYMTDFRLHILQKLIPGLQKEGYQEISSEGNSSDANLLQPHSPQGLRDHPIPSRFDPVVPAFPGGRNPLAYGDRDLNPLGGLGPGLPRFGGGGSALDPFGMIGDDQGGMILGPHHPMFSHPNPNAPPFPGGGRLPPGAVPPGARFDPMSPFDPRGNDPRSRFPGSNPRPHFSGEPDNDDLPPPGYNDMFM